MTVVRRSVEQTITRLALNQLRTRASAVGMPQARSDAAQALALLLDYRPEKDIPAACRTALALNIGCVMVQSDHVPKALDILWGSGVHIGMYTDDLETSYRLLNTGIGELELAAQAVLTPEGNWSTDLKELIMLCQNLGATLKLNLDNLEQDTTKVCELCLEADSLNIDVLTIPFDLLAIVRPSGHRFTGFKIPNITSLEQARLALNQGATRLGSSQAPELIGLASADKE